MQPALGRRVSDGVAGWPDEAGGQRLGTTVTNSILERDREEVRSSPRRWLQPPRSRDSAMSHIASQGLQPYSRPIFNMLLLLGQQWILILIKSGRHREESRHYPWFYTCIHQPHPQSLYFCICKIQTLLCHCEYLGFCWLVLLSFLLCLGLHVCLCTTCIQCPESRRRSPRTEVIHSM